VEGESSVQVVRVRAGSSQCGLLVRLSLWVYAFEVLGTLPRKGS
jgi:hypothetical protein